MMNPLFTKQVEAVIFDLGDTLICEKRLRYEAVEATLAEVKAINLLSPCDIELADLVAAYRSKDARLTGHAVNHLFSDVNMVRELFRELGVLRLDLATYSYVSMHRSFVMRNLVDSVNARQVLSELKASGFKIGVLSDGTSIEQFSILAWLGVIPLLDSVVVSQDVGASKPSKLMFRSVCAELFVKPDAALMIGNDLVRDYHGAIASGLQALLVDDLSTGPATREEVVKSISTVQVLPGLLRSAHHD